MNLICVLCNKIAIEPVVSPASGNVFERRLILKYLEENGNYDPINGLKLTSDMLVKVNCEFLSDHNRKDNSFTISELIKFLQEEWDAMVLNIFSLKKQLTSSNKEIQVLINQQNESTKIINILNNELINYKQLEEKKKLSFKYNTIQHDNVYTNLPISNSNYNKENIDISSSINSSIATMSTKSDFLKDSFQKPLESYCSNDTINKRSIQSPFCNKQLSYSTEYVNLNKKLLDRNHRTQSVIIQNDSLFDSEINSLKSCEDIFKSKRINFISENDINLLSNLSENELNSINRLSENSFKSYKNGFNYKTDFNHKTNHNYKQELNKPDFNSQIDQVDKSLKSSVPSLNNDELYCNLVDLKDFNQLSLNLKKKNLTNYENILMFNEDYQFDRNSKVDSLKLANNLKTNFDETKINFQENNFETKFNVNNCNGNKLNINSLINNNTNSKNFTQVKETTQKVGRIESWSKDFENLINDSLGIKVFTDFLIKERSDENIKFWQLCENFKNLTTKDELKKEAKIIYDNHFDKKAVQIVNVDSEAKAIVQKNLNNPTKDMFDKAQKQIYNLMKFDSYKRFLESETYKKFLECGKYNNLLPIELINSLKKPSLPTNKKQRRKSLLVWNSKKHK